ncbi:hypothetical protein EU537_05675 [Candidatus Thorarchaeota archaeon]|nr:MAG: hypothetical protein EU537_05675 [Candidatus Thorarchaeota archaeon]
MSLTIVGLPNSNSIGLIIWFSREFTNSETTVYYLGSILLTIIIGMPTPFLLLISLVVIKFYHPPRTEGRGLNEEG